jgi:mono/diheme cytochrome c family protein
MKYIISLSLLTFFLSSAMVQKNNVQRFSRIVKPLDNSGLTTRSKQTTDSGKIIYETYCLACHQEDGSGVPGMNPPLVKTDWVLGDSTRLINVILKGLKDTEIGGDSYSNEMPSHDFLTDNQIAEVLTYIRKSFGNQAGAIRSEDVKKQRAKK